MDGVSGPGVGSVIMFVHEGGVGMMMFGVGEITAAGDAGAGAQAVAKMERRKPALSRAEGTKEMSLLDIR